MAEHIRITCPSCAAVYEVDESVIPDAGRDVQCSACGTTWWQTKVLPEAPEAEEPAPVAQEPPAAIAEPRESAPSTVGEQPGPEQAPQTIVAEPAGSASVAESDSEATLAAEGAGGGDGTPAPAGYVAEDREEREADGRSGIGEAVPADDEEREGERWPADGDSLAAAVPGAAAAIAGSAAAARPQKSLDEAVLDVLREEAERESAARRAEQGLESQPDLGLDNAPPIDPVARERLEAEAVPGKPRTAKLPDVEELTSTLGADDADVGTIAESPYRSYLRRRTGFRIGFTLMMLAAVLIALTYSYAVPLATRFPQYAGQIEGLTLRLDRARLWLDEAAIGASERIEAMTDGN